MTWAMTLLLCCCCCGVCCCCQDVLGHPNTRAFVSHAGLHSVYEAAFHGVPLAAVPFHFESVSY